MNNEEKAKKIAMPCPACSCLWTKDMMYKQEYCKDCVPQDRFTGAMEMAQWKDEQYKNLIKERIDNCILTDAYESVQYETYMALFKDLFNEEP